MSALGATGQRDQLSAYLVTTDPVDVASGHPSRMVYATRTGRTLLLKERLWQALCSGQWGELNGALLVRLRALEVIVPAGQDEFAEVMRRNQAGLAEGDRLAVTIQPTANCQLSCGYCGQVHQKRNVDPTLSRQMTDRIIGNLTRHGYRRLSVRWYGAEPLMAYSEILSMSARLPAHCAQDGVAYQARMITNGMSFKPAVFLGLQEQGVGHYQITLDGLGETHDVMRITKEGHKSFDIIFGNIVAVTALPQYMASTCTITFRVNVNRRSAATVPRLIDHLAGFGLGARRVSLDFTPVVNWGGNGAGATGLTRGAFAEAEIEWMLYAIKKGFTFRRVVPARRNGPCTVVEKDAEVYDVQGNVFPCYEYPYTPAYAGAQYRIGHLDTIAVQRNEAALPKKWMADVQTDIAPCRACNLFPVCGGCCPKQWYNGQVACPSYKLNIKDRLLLDYLINQPGYLQSHLSDADFSPRSINLEVMHD